jgi:hypothetical protein
VKAVALFSAIILCGCASRPKHDPIWLSALATQRAEEMKDVWWIKYNTNALRLSINPLWDAEIGLKDDGTVIWRKIQPISTPTTKRKD